MGRQSAWGRGPGQGQTSRGARASGSGLPCGRGGAGHRAPPLRALWGPPDRVLRLVLPPRAGRTPPGVRVERGPPGLQTPAPQTTAAGAGARGHGQHHRPAAGPGQHRQNHHLRVQLQGGGGGVPDRPAVPDLSHAARVGGAGLQRDLSRGGVLPAAGGE
ncbi:hypothetical protein AAFF_G00277560, partial [Aldrovandia affinis]